MWRAWGRAIGIWWREIFAFSLLNVMWLGLSLTIVGAAPALAATYQLAAYAVDGDYVDVRKFFSALKKLALPAWRWGLLQVAVYGVISVNLLYYGGEDGLIFDVLRVLWVAGLVFWSALNLFYWPFFIAQDDCRLRVTYRNAVVFAVMRPWLMIGVALTSAVWIALSVGTVFLLALALIAPLALLGTLVVREELSASQLHKPIG